MPARGRSARASSVASGRATASGTAPSRPERSAISPGSDWPRARRTRSSGSGVQEAVGRTRRDGGTAATTSASFASRGAVAGPEVASRGTVAARRRVGVVRLVAPAVPAPHVSIVPQRVSPRRRDPAPSGGPWACRLRPARFCRVSVERTASGDRGDAAGPRPVATGRWRMPGLPAARDVPPLVRPRTSGRSTLVATVASGRRMTRKSEPRRRRYRPRCRTAAGLGARWRPLCGYSAGQWAPEVGGGSGGVAPRSISAPPTTSTLRRRRSSAVDPRPCRGADRQFRDDQAALLVRAAGSTRAATSRACSDPGLSRGVPVTGAGSARRGRPRALARDQRQTGGQGSAGRRGSGWGTRRPRAARSMRRAVAATSIGSRSSRSVGPSAPSSASPQPAEHGQLLVARTARRASPRARSAAWARARTSPRGPRRTRDRPAPGAGGRPCGRCC